MKIPIFFIAGAAKAGTTALHYYLSQNNVIAMSAPKETNYFDAYYDNIVEGYLNRYFSRTHLTQIIGDATPSYLYVPFVPNRISQHFPDAKIIIVLRNPVERAYSAWWMLYSRGYEKKNFQKAIESNLDRLENEQPLDLFEIVWKNHVDSIKQKGKAAVAPYVDGGYYANQIRNYLNFFDINQLKIILFEDFVKDSKKILEEIYRFLKIPSKENVNRSIKNKANSRVTSVIYKCLGPKAVMQISSVMPRYVKGSLKKILNKKSYKPIINKNIERRLYEHYLPYNKNLSKLLNRNLSHWHKKKINESRFVSITIEAALQIFD